MTEQPSGSDRFRAILVAVATVGTIAFNWLAVAGRINGIETGAIAKFFPTPVTPADYAFAIWTLIYVGMIAFSIYQLLPANVARFRGVRSYYILACALNCGWLYMWHSGQIAICFVLIFLLAACLFLINLHLKRTEGPSEYWLAKAPFELYFGWVTAATIVNFAVFLVYLEWQISDATWTWIGVVLILLAAALGVLIRIRLTDYLYPLAIAWALTGIGVKQSGNTLVVVAAAVGTIACLIASVSFVMNMPSTANPGHTAGASNTRHQQ